MGQGPEVLKCRKRLRVQPDEIGEVLFKQLQPFQTGRAVPLVPPIVLLFPQLVGIHGGIANENDLVAGVEVLQKPFRRCLAVLPEAGAVVNVAVNAVMEIVGVQLFKVVGLGGRLKQLAAPEAKVVRNGAVVRIPGREITVGDVVHLEAGDYIPADGRVLESASLKVDESALTGESIGVDKISAPLTGELPLGDRRNMVFSGSYVTYGRGVFLVTGIGMNTEVGKIAGLLKNTSEKKTPLQINLDRFGKKLSMIILLLCAVLFILQVLKGGAVADAFLFAVALAVAAIPEALSSIVTIVLAFGTRKMAKEGAIIRKLQSVEGLGSISVICSDKTGTLTQNRMTIEHYYVDGRDIPADEIDPEDPLQGQMLRFSILCNDSTNVEGQELGDPTETAMSNLGDRGCKRCGIYGSDG